MVSSLLVAALLFQPNPGALRRLFEENLEHRQNAQAARDLAGFLAQQGDAESARAAFGQALRLDEKEMGPNHPQTLADACELAQLVRPPAAEPLWQRASASSDASVAARALGALADLRAAARDNQGAIALLRQALAKEETASGKDGERVAERLNALAIMLAPNAAIPILERALAIDRKLHGERHPATATTLANLAGKYLDSGRTDAGFRAARAALATMEDTLGPDHPRTASAATVLAHCWSAKGDRMRAEQLYRRALAIDEAAYGPNHAEVLADVSNLATFLRDTGRAREAAELEKRLR